MRKLMLKIKKTIALVHGSVLGLIFFTTPLYANASIEFFSSNNNQEIDLRKAYDRLNGAPQKQLQNDIIRIIQNGHLQQGKFEDILGTYQMSTDKNITADNSEIFYTSPNQALSKQQAFSLAVKLANALDQDSIAVFIPLEKPVLGSVSVQFIPQDHYSINDTIKIVQQNLPISYRQAFSLHLKNTCNGFDQASVQTIEWLGSHIHIHDIKKAFPQEKISTQNGTAYLVYKNGKVESL